MNDSMCKTVSWTRIKAIFTIIYVNLLELKIDQLWKCGFSSVLAVRHQQEAPGTDRELLPPLAAARISLGNNSRKLTG